MWVTQGMRQRRSECQDYCWVLLCQAEPERGCMVVKGQEPRVTTSASQYYEDSLRSSTWDCRHRLDKDLIVVH